MAQRTTRLRSWTLGSTNRHMRRCALRVGAPARAGKAIAQIWKSIQYIKWNDWRRGRDSNPRYPCEYAAFRVRCFQPLSHLSEAASPTPIPLKTQANLADLFVLFSSVCCIVLQFWTDVLQIRTFNVRSSFRSLSLLPLAHGRNC